MIVNILISYKEGMKKLLMMACASALLVLAGSCSNKGEKQDSADSASTEVQDTPAVANAKKGAKYLADLQAKDSTVHVTESGLGYKVIKPGEGASPVAESVAQVIYTGKHLDGSQFDSSNGTPVPFPLQRVVPGFSEGIMKMNKGAVYELYIPGQLGYGPDGAPQAGIGPNEMLVFEVELVDFE